MYSCTLIPNRWSPGPQLQADVEVGASEFWPRADWLQPPLRCLPVSFCRASLPQGNLAGHPLFLCPHHLPWLPISSCHFSESFTWFSCMLFFFFLNLLHSCIKFYRDQGEKPTIFLSLPTNPFLSVTYTHNSRQTPLTLPCSQIANQDHSPFRRQVHPFGGFTPGC